MSAAASSSHGAGAKRKFDGAAAAASSSASSAGATAKAPASSWKKLGGAGASGSSSSGGSGGASAPWKKHRPNPLPAAANGNGAPWVKAAVWKANTPVALSRKDREQMKKDRKAAKPNADIIAEANKVWQVSLTQMSAAERATKINELLDAVTGKVAEVGLKHDASRAIQIAIKYSDESQKQRLIKELTGHFRALSEDHYGHYIIIKMLSNDTKKGDAKKICMTEFKGHVTKLSSHPDSAKVLDYLYASVKSRDQSSLLQEFYSPEFVVFANDEATQGKNLTELLAAKPEKKMQIMENLRKYLDKSLEKSMLMFRFVHALLLQYLTHAPLGVETSAEFLPNLHQFIPALHHSVDGCRIICHLLSVGTSAKERKNILKYFKGIVPNMSERAEGVWVIDCALDVVDDTVLLDKVIFAELLPQIKEQILHQYSAKIYMHVLNSHDAAIFSANEQDNYSLSGKWILNQTDAASRAGPLSKKDPKQKRLELLNCFLLPLLQTISTMPDTMAALIRSNTGHHLLIEAVREAWRLQHDAEAQAALTAASSEPVKPAAGGKKNKKKGAGAAAAGAADTAGAEADVKAKEEGDDESAPSGPVGPKFPASLAKKLPDVSTHLGYIFDAIVAECARELDPTDAAATDARGAKSNPLEDRFGHYVVKRLIAALSPPAMSFVDNLIAQALEPQLLVMATTNRPAFVLAAILENPALAAAAKSLKSKLQPLMPKISTAAASAPVAPAVKQEEAAAAASSSAPAKFVKKNAATYAAHSTTNAGVTLLTKLVQGLPTDKKHTDAAGKKGAAAAAASSAAAASAPVAPAAQPAAPQAAAAAPKSAKKKAAAAAASAGVVKMETDEEAQPAAASAPSAAAAPAAAAAAAPSPARGHRRQWTHSNEDGTKESRLHRSSLIPEGDEAEGEAAAAPAASARTPAKAKATPAKKQTAKKATVSKKKPAADDMEDE